MLAAEGEAPFGALIKIGARIEFGRGADGQAEAVCISEGTSSDQMRVVFPRYVESQPQDWNKPALVLVYEALEQA